jgi:hypothetical protein
MFAAIARIWAFFYRLFVSAERGAMAVDELADWAHRAAHNVNTKARIEHTVEMRDLGTKYGIDESDILDLSPLPPPALPSALPSAPLPAPTPS